MRTILFQGNTIIKEIDLYDHYGIEAEVTPSIIMQDGKNCWDEDEVRMGLLLQCVPLRLLENAPEDASLGPFEAFNGHAGLNDPIIWWRALQCLEEMESIKEIFHVDLYWGVGRYEKENYFQRQVSRIREVLGDQAYQEIMQRPVPQEILALLIRMADEGQEVYHALRTVSDEINARTIRWSQELRRIGVKHPDYWRAFIAAKIPIVHRYEPYLFSYAAYSGHPYGYHHSDKCIIALDIEWRVIEAVERSIEEDYGADVACQLGILRAEIETDDILEDLEKKSRGREMGRKPFSRPPPEQRFQEITTWFAQSFSQEPVSGKPLHTSQQEYLDLLHRLYEQWEALPVLYPLVPEPR